MTFCRAFSWYPRIALDMRRESGTYKWGDGTPGESQSVARDSPLSYASEFLVIRAENVNSPLKPTVQSLVKIALL